MLPGTQADPNAPRIPTPPPVARPETPPPPPPIVTTVIQEVVTEVPVGPSQEEFDEALASLNAAQLAAKAEEAAHAETRAKLAEVEQALAAARAQAPTTILVAAPAADSGPSVGDVEQLTQLQAAAAAEVTSLREIMAALEIKLAAAQEEVATSAKVLQAVRAEMAQAAEAHVAELGALRAAHAEDGQRWSEEVEAVRGAGGAESTSLLCGCAALCASIRDVDADIELLSVKLGAALRASKDSITMIEELQQDKERFEQEMREVREKYLAKQKEADEFVKALEAAHEELQALHGGIDAAHQELEEMHGGIEKANR